MSAFIVHTIERVVVRYIVNAESEDAAAECVLDADLPHNPAYLYSDEFLDILDVEALSAPESRRNRRVLSVLRGWHERQTKR